MELQNQAPESVDLEDALEFLVPRGFPTFDQFRKDPDKYRGRPDELLESIQNSVTIPQHRKLLAEQRCYWRYGKEHFPLEKLERVLVENGYTVRDCDMLIQYRENDSGTGKDVIHVRVFPKHEMRSMGAVVPNG